MRKRISISLPQHLLKLIETLIQKHGFASESEFIRYLIRHWSATEFEHFLEKEKEVIPFGFNIPADLIKAIQNDSESKN